MSYSTYCQEFSNVRIQFDAPRKPTLIRVFRASRVAVISALLLGGLALDGPVNAATPLSISVDGNHLVNGAGQIVQLLGVDRSGAEYECVSNHKVFDGPSDAASVAVMASWHINAVRVPLNEDCWLGINGVITGGKKYRNAIVQYVATLQSYGLYVILDLHLAAPAQNIAITQWPMADADHSPKFWKSVATTFMTNHGVLFDLYNEPYVKSWPCWRNGCSTTYDSNGHKVTYQTAGMQQLVNAVRGTGATTPLMLGGLAWSNNETNWQRFEPVDHDHQLVVSFHTYNWNGCNNVTCWDSNIAPLAAVVPIVTGEFGESGCTDSYDLEYMAWADAHGVSYLGWTWDATDENWNCSGGPALIESYNGTPTAYGIGLKEHLAALALAATTG